MSAAVLVVLPLACGGQSQLDQFGTLDGRDGGKGGGIGGNSGISAGGAGPHADASAGAQNGGKSSSTPDGGSGAAGRSAAGGSGTGGTAGGTASAGGAAGASGTGATPGGGGSNLEADAQSPLIDSHADERRTLSEDYCATCGQSCVACTPGPGCAADLNNQWFNDVPVACWDELVASEKCSKANGCYAISGGQLGGGPCLAERTALDDCIRTGDVYRGTITGAVTTCDWRRLISGVGCQVSCAEDPLRFYSTDCSGPPNGPFACWCDLNGRQLVDSMISNGARFFTDTCQAAGQLMADGHCHKFVSCCYTFRGVLQQGLPEQDLCECTSDPTAGGNFDSCEALAVSHTEGKVIDLCPGYEPLPVVP